MPVFFVLPSLPPPFVSHKSASGISLPGCKAAARQQEHLSPWEIVEIAEIRLEVCCAPLGSVCCSHSSSPPRPSGKTKRKKSFLRIDVVLRCHWRASQARLAVLRGTEWVLRPEGAPAPRKRKRLRRFVCVFICRHDEAMCAQPPSVFPTALPRVCVLPGCTESLRVGRRTVEEALRVVPGHLM